MIPFSTVKVFSATLARDRENLGERMSEWLRAHPEFTLVDCAVRQSSDDAFHCLTFTAFLQETAA